jgi:hypothetical protein
MSSAPLIVVFCLLVVFQICSAFLRNMLKPTPVEDGGDRGGGGKADAAAKGDKDTSTVSKGVAPTASPPADPMEAHAFAEKLPIMTCVAVIGFVDDLGQNLVVSFVRCPGATDPASAASQSDCRPAHGTWHANRMMDARLASQLPAELDRHTGSEAVAGPVVAGLAVGMVIGFVIAPLLIRRYGPFELVRNTLPLVAIGCSISGLSTTCTSDATGVIAIMIAGRLVQGVAAGVNEFAGQATLYRMFVESDIPKAKAVVWSLRLLSNVGAPLFGSVFYSIGGFPAPFLFLATVTAVTAV